jgi:site-specific recombinase XerD
MLTIWRRHNPKKCKLKGRQERKCRCAIWISGIDAAGSKIKETTKLRDWTRAEALARHWDNTGAKPLETARVSIEEWKNAFLTDAAAPSGKNLNSETVRKYKLLFKQLDAFAEREGYRFVNQLDLAALTKFRTDWKDAALSASKKLERLRTTLKFALRRKWIPENPAVELDSPKITPNPTLPFSNYEMEQILKAAKKPADRAFILVMRYSGLRISDTCKLAVESVKNKRLRLYQAKTGQYVYVPIPRHVAKALSDLPTRVPDIFSGQAIRQTETLLPCGANDWLAFSVARRLRTATVTASATHSPFHCLRRVFLWKMSPYCSVIAAFASPRPTTHRG